MRTRIIAVGIITNPDGEYLLCKNSDQHGVYPGQWGLVGGGLEEGEELERTMERELQEETQLRLLSLKPLFFETDRKVKQRAGLAPEDQYLVFLYFEVEAEGEVVLNHEWVDYAWVAPDKLDAYDMNSKTKTAFERLGILPKQSLL